MNGHYETTTVRARDDAQLSDAVDTAGTAIAAAITAGMMCADDSGEPGWSVNGGCPLWLGDRDLFSHRQVMRLGAAAAHGYRVSILLATVSANWTRQQVNNHLDTTRRGVRLIELDHDDVEVLTRFLTFAVARTR